jgi:hypothetical protein
MNDEEFFEIASQPDYPDEIILQIDRSALDNDPETTLSEGGVETVVHQFRNFLYARLRGQMDKGHAVKHLQAHIRFSYGQPTAPIGDPTLVDHTRREGAS